MIGESITVFRGDTDKYGNSSKSEHGTVEGLFAWGPGVTTTRARTNDSLKGESAEAQIEFYAPRGADLKPRDRIRRANGQEFRILAGPMWDQVHPFDGFDFGWALYQVVTVSG